MENTFLVGRNEKDQDYLLRKVKGTREHIARVTPEITYSGQKANLKLLFSLSGDVGISNVQTQKETIIVINLWASILQDIICRNNRKLAE